MLIPAISVKQPWADRLGTIPYEVLVGFGTRLPRSYPG